MSLIFYCRDKQNYFVDDWLVAVVVGTKALLQKKDGKRTQHATFVGGRVTEQRVGAKQDCGGPFIATSKGWRLDE